MVGVMTWNNFQWRLRMLLFDCYQMLMGGWIKKSRFFVIIVLERLLHMIFVYHLIALL